MLILHTEGLCQATLQDVWAILIYKLPHSSWAWRYAPEALEKYLIPDKCMIYPDEKSLERDWNRSLLVDRDYWKHEGLTPIKKAIRIARVIDRPLSDKPNKQWASNCF